jgi:hypothetical protein
MQVDKVRCPLVSASPPAGFRNDFLQIHFQNTGDPKQRIQFRVLNVLLHVAHGLTCNSRPLRSKSCLHQKLRRARPRK